MTVPVTGVVLNVTTVDAIFDWSPTPVADTVIDPDGIVAGAV